MPVSPFALLRSHFNLLFTYSLLFFRATLRKENALGRKCNYALSFAKIIDRLLTSLIHDNATGIDFLYLNGCHDRSFSCIDCSLDLGRFELGVISANI